MTSDGHLSFAGLQVIADPLRWQLLGELGRSDRRVGELTRLVGRPQNLVSYHLRALREAGLVTSRRSAFDGRDTYYRVDLARCGEVLCAAGSSLHPGVRLSVAAPDVRVRRQPARVLFLCTGNSARSQMAAALLEERSAHTIDARSAGSHPKTLHPHAVRVMADRGIDIAGHPTTHLDEFAGQRFDQVVTLCDKVREVCPEFPGVPDPAHWSMADPAAEVAGAATDDETLPAFERTAEELESRIPPLIAAISIPAHEGDTTHV